MQYFSHKKKLVHPPSRFFFLHSWPGASSAASHLEEQPLLQRLLYNTGGVPQNSVTKTACKKRNCKTFLPKVPQIARPPLFQRFTWNA